jgi:hypothetical protein
MIRSTFAPSARREEINGAEDLRSRRILMGRKKSLLQEMDTVVDAVLLELLPDLICAMIARHAYTAVIFSMLMIWCAKSLIAHARSASQKIGIPAQLAVTNYLQTVQDARRILTATVILA